MNHVTRSYVSYFTIAKILLNISRCEFFFFLNRCYYIQEKRTNRSNLFLNLSNIIFAFLYDLTPFQNSLFLFYTKVIKIVKHVATLNSPKRSTSVLSNWYTMLIYAEWTKYANAFNRIARKTYKIHLWLMLIMLIT